MYILFVVHARRQSTTCNMIGEVSLYLSSVRNVCPQGATILLRVSYNIIYNTINCVYYIVDCTSCATNKSVIYLAVGFIT